MTDAVPQQCSLFPPSPTPHPHPTPPTHTHTHSRSLTHMADQHGHGRAPHGERRMISHLLLPPMCFVLLCASAALGTYRRFTYMSHVTRGSIRARAQQHGASQWSSAQAACEQQSVSCFKIKKTCLRTSSYSNATWRGRVTRLDRTRRCPQPKPSPGDGIGCEAPTSHRCERRSCSRE